MDCIYCKGLNNSLLSKEHVISKMALIKALGKNKKGNVRNITGSSLFKKYLIDHEQTIKDVCEICNQLLSPYDTAGADLVSEIDSFCDATDKTLTLNKNKINWLVKTHLNIIRTLPRKKIIEKYDINQSLYDNLINFKTLPIDLFILFFEGWKGEDYFWSENDPRKITYFSFSSVEFPAKDILVSFFRMKSISTYMFIPSNNNYEDFIPRVRWVIDLFNKDGKFEIQQIPTITQTKEWIIKIEKVFSFNSSEPLFHELKRPIS